MAKALSGRTESDVRNRFYSLDRNRRRNSEEGTMASNKPKQQSSNTSAQFATQENGTNQEFDGTIVPGEVGQENNDDEDAEGTNKVSSSENGAESTANDATGSGAASINDLINEINKNNTKRKSAPPAAANKRPKRGGKYQDNMSNLYMNGLYPATATSGTGQSQQQLMAFPVPYTTNAQGGYSYIGNSNMYQHVPSLVNDPRVLASIQSQTGDMSNSNNNNMVPAST